MDKTLDVAGAAELLGVGGKWLRGKVKRREFATPDVDGRWTAKAVFAWAAASDEPDLRRRVPLRYLPPASRIADYLGARRVGGRHDEHMILTWDTDLGEIHLVYGVGNHFNTEPEHALSWVDAASTLTLHVVWIDYDVFRMPALESVVGATGYRDDGTTWGELRAALGQRAPFWPFGLRDPRLMENWQPDAETVTAPAGTSLDISLFLRLAAHEADLNSPVAQTLLHFARRIQGDAAREAADDVNHVESNPARDDIAIAARPLPAPQLDHEDLPETTRRIAWRDILLRTDDLSAACVQEKLGQNGGQDFPWPASDTLTPRPGSVSQEWARRLHRVPRTVGHSLLARNEDPRAYLADPATDAPVLETTENTYIVAIPDRLPTTSPLSEVILDQRPWVRTADGTLYPMPEGHQFGYMWGYSGTGPANLAAMIGRLLDDINAAAADQPTEHTGLTTLMISQDRYGTAVLTREELLAARDHN